MPALGVETIAMAEAFTILFVDDDELVRAPLAALLTLHGMRVLTAVSAIEAMRVLALERVDVLFTDIVMPGIDGAEVVERLMPLRPQMKIIFMSGYPGRVPLHPASVAYLQKPFTRAKLIEVLRQVME